MAEKSRWGLGAKLRGLFGGSSSKNTSSEEQEVTPEVIEDVTVDLAIAPTETVATVESKTIATEQLEVIDAPEQEAESTPQPQPEPASVQAPVEEHEYIPEPTPEKAPVPVPVPEPAPASPAEPVTEKKPKPVKTEAPKVTIKPSRKATITEETWDELEEMLLGADFGPDITEELIDTMRANIAKYQTTDSDDFVRMLREAIEERLSKFDTTLKLSERPAVVLVVGVNGVGKTTTIGKFAKYVASAGKSVVVGAADTFRAAAVEQLATWAERAGVEVVRPQIDGQDPSAVAYQTIEHAINKGIEIVIIDTAGRLQTKSGLMDELSKIRRVIEKQAPVAEVLLVLDATTGQNGLSQAEAFLEHAGVTGLVLTKLDGSAKGGFVLAVQEKTGIPVKLIGTGEGIGDLSGFTPVAFAAQLVS